MRSEPSSTKSTVKPNKIKLAVFSVIVLAAAVACIFAFAGNKPETLSETVEDAAPVSPASDETSLHLGDEGYGVYVDGDFVAAVTSEAVAMKAFDNVLDGYAAKFNLGDNAESKFTNEISVVGGEFDSEAFTTASGLEALLDGSVNYLNLPLSSEVSVETVADVEDIRTLYYETKLIYTDSLPSGTDKVVSAGSNGEADELYRITYINGIETERELLSSDVISEPTERVVRVGTSISHLIPASFGGLIKPYEDGQISSRFGVRWGRSHTGIDIVAKGRDCGGDSAKSAGDGVVIFARNSGAYGNCVKVDHGDGIVTLYAHLSKITVKVGDTLSAGDEVGKIGSTGRSTGNHLHFEVHIDGTPVDPLYFVTYTEFV